MPCYNAGQFIGKSIDSVIQQSFLDWELVIVDDGSTDNSREISLRYAQIENRIRVVAKENGGYVSARLYGLDFISPTSEFLLFYDADDVLHPNMLNALHSRIAESDRVGAIYCNHKLIDGNDQLLGDPNYGIRVVPTLFWMKVLKEEVSLTPFISIFCWATRMIEPMTLIRRKAYDLSSGWDQRFGKGKGNIGDGVLLFSELSLTWDVIYLMEPLYFYRKHGGQITNSTELNQKAGDKVLMIWKEKIKKDKKFEKDIRAAIICYKYRLYAFLKVGSLKHTFRYNPILALKLVITMAYYYCLSLRLLFYRKTKVYQY
jgi:glycosyltransferase involved in cell wall biosynthesis